LFRADIEQVAGAARKKVDFLNHELSKYFILSMFAGLFVGLGIVLIFFHWGSAG
jgi:nitrite transporter NirC